MKNNRRLVRDSCTEPLQGTKTYLHITDSMNNTPRWMHSLLTGVRRSMGCWRSGDVVSHTILMVIFSVELLDKICGDIQKTKVQSLQVVKRSPHHILYYLVLVDSTGEWTLTVIDSWKSNSSSQTADIPESTDLHGNKEKYLKYSKYVQTKIKTHRSWKVSCL